MGTTQNAFVGGSPNLWSYVILDAYVLPVIPVSYTHLSVLFERSNDRSYKRLTMGIIKVLQCLL